MQNEALLAIPERETIRDLWRLSNRYLHTYGTTVENISHWNPSVAFKKGLHGLLEIPSVYPIIDYVMSINLTESEGVLEKLGFNRASHYALITPTGTISILSVISLLKEQGVERVVFTAPFYWTALHICRQLNIRVEKIYLERANENFRYPDSLTHFTQIDLKKIAFWFTNPIYCTGVHLKEATLKIAKKFIEKNAWVIIDECLCSKGNELGPYLKECNRFLGIYAPHKSVCINGIKFSALVTTRRNRAFVDHWSTVHYGCLSAANKAAAMHYISENFDIYLNKFTEKIRSARRYIVNLSKRYTRLSIDSEADSYLNTLYFEEYAGDISKDLNWLWSLIKTTGAIIIPGIRNHFSPDIGFCFRVNLAADSPRFRSRLESLVDYLSKN